MISVDVMIVGGGPAGSACAWKLQKQHMDVLLLDKAAFPRMKPCAGWITPQVLRDLEIEAADYPLGITHFHSFQVYLNQFHLKLNTNQYAIRRWEFDDWLLQRSQTRHIQHTVQDITFEDGLYVIDEAYCARYLVGAGGTHCPVQRSLFQEVRHGGRDGSLIVAQEEEFAYDYADDRCFLWFFQNGLPGYAWYVPKANGYVNVGVGGSAAALKSKQDTLKRHWGLLVDQLDRSGLVRGHAYKPLGHSYYLRGKQPGLRQGNAFLVGDAAGLATLDMGEGIGPAIHSGIQAAQAILAESPYMLGSLSRYSLPSLLRLR